MQMLVEVLGVLSTDMHMSVGALVPMSGSMAAGPELDMPVNNL